MNSLLKRQIRKYLSKELAENKELEKARLLLIRCVQIVTKAGLNLLGIKTLDKM